MPPTTQALQAPAKKPSRKRRTAPAPGARVLIRDEEWIVRKTHRTSSSGRSDGLALHVQGSSGLVQNLEAIFLEDLDTWTELRPEETGLVVDESPNFRRSRLFLESLLRSSPPTDNRLYVGHRGAMRPSPYQLEPAALALSQPRSRVLIGDAVGLGKTVEVGILLSELAQRGRANRILVVALKSVLSQFQRELWARFTLPLVRLDSVGLQRVQSKIPAHQNPFHYFDRSIISVDTLKKDAKYRTYIEQAHWDVIVVDECQHVAERGTGAGRSQRSRLARLLADRCDTFILASATPHDGKAESFASLIRLLDPTPIADPERFDASEIGHLFIRRAKKDVAAESEDAFRERRIVQHSLQATEAENEAFRVLASLDLRSLGRTSIGGARALFTTHLTKSLLSSSAACLGTIDARSKNLAKKMGLERASDSPEAHDLRELDRLRSAVAAIDGRQSVKYTHLLNWLKAEGVGAKGKNECVVIFSERLATLAFLERALQEDLKLKDGAVAVFHGSLDDQQQKERVESFGVAASPLRILLASDAASEGINLHHSCHRLVHYDLPWSVISLEQRNGRIDRFGQQHEPEIHYLLTIPDANSFDPSEVRNGEVLRGELRVAERLIEKEEQAHRNLGDAAFVLELHSVIEEEEHIAAGLEQGRLAEEILPDQAPTSSLFDMLFGDEAPHREAQTAEPVRLFENDLDYARTAFAELQSQDDTQKQTMADAGYNAEEYCLAGNVEFHETVRGFELFPSADLLRRYEELPPELRRMAKDQGLKLTTDRERVMQALEDARKSEENWPEWELFWEQHPVSRWLDDRVLSCLERHEAPILRLPQSAGVGPNERIVVLQAVVSNERTQPVIVEWLAVRFEVGPGSPPLVVGIEPLRDLIEDLGLARDLPNPATTLTQAEITQLRTLLEPSLAAVKRHIGDLRIERMAQLNETLREGVKRVSTWRDRRLEAIAAERADLKGAAQTPSLVVKRRQLEEREREVQRTYEEHQRFLKESLKTVPDPFLRIAAVVVSNELAA